MASTTLISTTSFGTPTGNYDGSTSSFNSIEVKGDGYLGFSDGLHTVSWRLTGFIGTITVQGSLAKIPQSSDWFNIRLGSGTSYSVDTTGLVTAGSVTSVSYTTATTISNTYNLTGNFVWIRVLITDFSAGTINTAQINL